MRGFTLLELLLVLVIVGVLATMVSLSVSGRAVEDRMQSEARRVEELLRLAADEAQAKGVEIGFRQTESGFEFLTPDESGQRWTLVEDRLLRAREVAEPFYLELRVDGRLLKPGPPTPPAKPDEAESDEDVDEKAAADRDARAPIEPQVLILSSGEMTAFTLDLRLRDQNFGYRIEGSALGELKTTRMQVREE